MFIIGCCECAGSFVDDACQTNSQLFDDDDDAISSSCLAAAAEPGITALHLLFLVVAGVKMTTTTRV